MKMMTMKILRYMFLLIIPVCFRGEVFAQSETGANPFINDSNGRPLYMKSNYNTEGSPFLFEDYLPVTLISLDGKYYSDIMVKVNLVDKEIYYRLPDGKEMVSTTPVKQIIFTVAPISYPGLDSIIITSLNSAVNAKGADIAMVCADGKLKLLTKINITYKDTQEYGNTNTTRTFTRKEYFEYIRGNNAAEKLPKSPDAIVQLMNDRKKDIQTFIISQNLDLRMNTDLVRLFLFYNQSTPLK
ncbi:hypothetical protein [Flavitalea sp.]|nr:hypothetical protein [Flavitalea sp.]